MFSKTAFTTLFLATAFSMAFAQDVAARPVKSDDTVLSKTVRYSRADLSTEAGARSLLSRIRRAANQVCSGNDPIVQMNRGSHFRSCVQAASSRAVAQVDHPNLTALYNSSGVQLATK